MRHNGHEISKKTKIRHKDRLVFGTTNLYILIEPDKDRDLDVTWEEAQAEIAKRSGFDFCSEDALLAQEAMALHKAVNDANIIADELGIEVKLRLLIIAPELRDGDASQRSECRVQAFDSDLRTEWVWKKGEFLDRQVAMRDAYEVWENLNTKPSAENNPWFDDSPQLVGVGSVPLQYLAHLFEFVNEEVVLLDYSGRQAGFLRVDIIPNVSQDDKDRVKDPQDLINMELCFSVHVQQGLSLPNRFTKTWCTYKFREERKVTTDQCNGSNPRYDFETSFRLRKVDRLIVDYLLNNNLYIEVWGFQESVNLGSHLPVQSSKEEVKKLKGTLRSIAEVLNNERSNSSKVSFYFDYLFLFINNNLFLNSLRK